MKLFATFAKVDEQDDGTLIVEGIASTEAVDAQGEIVKASAIEAALPDYMRHGTGALREMHQPLAAGTAVATVDGETTTVRGHVVDPIAVKKVQAGVYKGFSIGGRVTKRDAADKKTITGISLAEISLVDRPANPDAVLTMWKADVHGEEPGDGEASEAEPAPLAKGMWDVAELAGVLQQLRNIQASATWEAEYEGDGSAMPSRLAACVTALADVLVEMVAEEAQEVKDSMPATDEPADTVEAAAPAAAIQSESAAEPVAKVETVAAETLTKADLADALTKAVAAALAPMQAELAALKARPAPTGTAVRAVAKVADAGQPAVTEVEPIRKADGAPDTAATLIKQLHRTGGLLA